MAYSNVTAQFTATVVVAFGRGFVQLLSCACMRRRSFSTPYVLNRFHSNDDAAVRDREVST